MNRRKLGLVGFFLFVVLLLAAFMPVQSANAQGGDQDGRARVYSTETYCGITITEWLRLLEPLFNRLGLTARVQTFEAGTSIGEVRESVGRTYYGADGKVSGYANVNVCVVRPASLNRSYFLPDGDMPWVCTDDLGNAPNGATVTTIGSFTAYTIQSLGDIQPPADAVRALEFQWEMMRRSCEVGHVP